jgi:hypothetical protein
MRRDAFGVLLAVAILMSSAVDASAQLELGIKVPPVNLPALLVSYRTSESQLWELEVSYQSSQLRSIVSAGVSGKLLLDDSAVGVGKATPVLGIGASTALISLHVLGQTFWVTVMSVNLLWGVEYRLSDSRNIALAEIRHSLSFVPFGLIDVGAAIGVKLEL